MIQLRFANQTRVREFFRYAPVLASIVLCHTVAAAQTDPEVPQSEEQLRLDVQDVVYVRPLGDPGAWTHIASELASDPSSDHPALVMNTAPGVNIQMNSGQEHLVSIRSPVLTGGAGQGSFLVLIDGVPTRAPAFGNVNALFEIPYETAAGIEIVRGPGSARYGSNAVHGVINVIERSPADTESFAQASINTEDRLRFDGVSTRKIGDHDWMLAGSVLSDPGWREASGVEQQKLTAKLDGNMGPWNWLLTVDGTNLNQETAGYIQGEDAYKDRDLARSNPNPEAFRDAWSARTNLRLQRELGHGELTLIPFALTQRMIFKQHFLPYKGLEKNGHDSVGLLSRYALNAGNVDWTIGADAQWANGYLTETQDTPFGFFPGDSRFPVGVHYDYTVETISLAGFAEARVRLAENWRLLAGLRAEHHDYDYGTDIPAGVFGRFKVAADRSDRFTLITPKLGVTWSAPAGVDIYANYSRGERAPQSSDLYRLQSLQEIADVDVETNDSIEIGMRGQLSSGVDYNLAIYAMEKSNFFFRDADGLNVSDGATNHAGIEIDAAYRPETGWRWSGRLSYSEHDYDFDRIVANGSEVIMKGNQIDTAPNWMGGFSIGYAFDNVTIDWAVEHVGRYYSDAANQHDYPGHTLHDLRANWQLNDALSLFASVQNVTDERYADRADYAFGEDRYFPGEERRATFGLRISDQ